MSVDLKKFLEPYCDDHSGNLRSDDNGIMLLGSVAPDGRLGQSHYFSDGVFKER